jgi:hypothetical protein
MCDQNKRLALLFTIILACRCLLRTCSKRKKAIYLIAGTTIKFSEDFILFLMKFRPLAALCFTRTKTAMPCNIQKFEIK